MAATFEEVVRAWLLYYDDRLPSDRRARREAFIILLGNLADHSYSKEDITLSKKEKIIKYCVNPNHKNKSKLKKWVSIIVNDLEAAILIYYPVVKIRDDVMTPEMDAKLENMDRRAEESKKLKTSDDDIEDNVPEEFSIEDSRPLDIRDALKNPGKEEETFEITDDMLGDIEGPEVVYDKDFMKRFGLE
jgi:hypothetical protein